jgi:FdhD protein
VSPLAQLALAHWSGRRAETRTDWVIEEQPVALVYNGLHYAVMMCTPQDLVDFAYGFSFTEGLIDHADALKVLEIVERDDGIVLEMALANSSAARLQSRQRQLLGSSGCGICGSAALAQLRLNPPPVTSDPRITLNQLQGALSAMSTAQVLNQRTGGVHAAGIVQSNKVIVREDVGRHNALDKLIGHCLQTGITPDFVVLSSRASFEMVHKAAVANIAVMVAISAPTAMAVRTALACGLTLVAFAREQQMNVYSHPARVLHV